MGRRIVEVTWMDAAHLVHSAWADRRKYERETPIRVRTVGYVLRDDTVAIVVAGGLNATGQAAGVAVIPRGMVERVRELEGA